MARLAILKGRVQFADVLITLGLIFVSLFWLVPAIWVVALSFKPNAELLRGTSGAFTGPYTIANYVSIVSDSLIVRWLLNSFIVAASSTVVTLILSSLAGYALARLEFPLKRTLFAVLVAGLAIPDQSIVIPLHALVGSMGLHNTHAALVFPQIATPLGVLLMTQFFRGIPKAIEEAALIDNATRLTIFLRIILPMSFPAQATLGIYTFLEAWNDYLWPLISATRPDMYTLTVGLASMQVNLAQTEGLGFLMAQAVFGGLPILLLYVIFQRYIIQAIGGGAVK